MVRPLIRHKIGNGERTSLWFDNWHPHGSISTVWGNRVIYDSGLHLNSMVSAIVSDNHWDWPLANSPELIEIRQNMPL